VVVLEGQEITKRFGGLLALAQVDFQIQADEVVGLIGPNGSGKTTLFNIISGFLRPEAGQVLWEGRRIDHLSPHKIVRLGLGRTFQIVKPLPELNLAENVAVGAMYGAAPIYGVRAARERAREILDFCGLGDKEKERPDELGLVDLKRLEVARALALAPKVLLLDEVFAGLNPSEVDAAVMLTLRIKERFRVAIFMIEHIMKAIMGACSRIMVLQYGMKIAEGEPKVVARDARVVEAYLGEGYDAASE
jgi:branched-chain amino acid transport system ATP-binding protein